MKFVTLDDLHDVLFEKFEFTDFYGRNISALIDCLSSLRYPEDEMIGINLAKDEVLTIKIKFMSNLNDFCLNHFLVAIENVNRFEKSRDRIPSIVLILS